MESVRMHVTGKTGHGKSYWVKNTLIPLLAKDKPVIIFDRKGEYAGPRVKDVPGKWNHYPSIFSFFEYLKKTGGTIEKDIHVITCRRDEDYKHGLAYFYSCADQQMQGGFPVSVVLDEAQDLLRSKDFAAIKEMLIQLARHGRHENIDVVLISQRTKDLPTDIRSQLQAYVSFHQALKYDIDALIADGYPEAEKLLDLKPREYIAFGEIPKRLNKIYKGAKK